LFFFFYQRSVLLFDWLDTGTTLSWVARKAGGITDEFGEVRFILFLKYLGRGSTAVGGYFYESKQRFCIIVLKTQKML
jgi:hypothetical protein